MHRALDEMVEFYSADPVGRRALIFDPDEPTGSCVMHTEDDRQCAYGRMVKPEYRLLLLDSAGLGGLSEHGAVPPQHQPEFWLEEYIGLPLTFVYALQHLHDSSLHWDENGLSLKGHEAVEKLRARIQRDSEDQWMGAADGGLGVIPVR